MLKSLLPTKRHKPANTETLNGAKGPLAPRGRKVAGGTQTDNSIADVLSSGQTRLAPSPVGRRQLTKRAPDELNDEESAKGGRTTTPPFALDRPDVSCAIVTPPPTTGTTAAASLTTLQVTTSSTVALSSSMRRSSRGAGRYQGADESEGTYDDGGSDPWLFRMTPKDVARMNIGGEKRETPHTTHAI